VGHETSDQGLDVSTVRSHGGFCSTVVSVGQPLAWSEMCLDMWQKCFEPQSAGVVYS
jgi:hypothetical protein